MDRCTHCQKPTSPNAASSCSCGNEHVNQENLATVAQGGNDSSGSASSLARPSTKAITLAELASAMNNAIIPVSHRAQDTLPELRNVSHDLSEAQTAKTLLERNAKMLFNETIADVHFIVGEGDESERIPAHTYVLALGSSVFLTMFNGDFDKESIVRVPDVEPYAFRMLLRYLYCDKLDLCMDIVIPVLYAAKKYLVSAVIQSCLKYIEQSLTADNVCSVLSQRRLFDEGDLTSRCWELIDAQAELVLSSPGLMEIDKETLNEILSRESLAAREAVVFMAATSWASAECERRGIQPTGHHKKKVLGETLDLIRIGAMSVQEFADGPAQSGILSYEETTDIFLYFTANAKPQISFQSEPRRGLPIRKCARFQSSACRSNQWRYRGRCDAIQFWTDKRIFVAALGLFGSSKGTMDHEAHVELKRGSDTLSRKTTRFTTDGTAKVFGIYFDQPIKIEPRTWYTASASFDGLELSFFGQEGQPEVTCRQRDNVFVTFAFQCSGDSTNGTGVHGGQIPEIWFYV